MSETREEKNKELEENLRKEEKKDKRKKIGKKILKTIFIILLIITLSIFYMHYIGTYGVYVREYKVESKNLPDDFNGFKVVHFSDLHYLTTIKDKEVKKIVNKINELRPDIVVFTGDLIDNNKEITNDDIKLLTKRLKKIEAKIGMNDIKGHDDYNNHYEQVMSETNFKIINNSYELIYYKGNTPILLTGVGSILKNDCDIDQAFSYSEMDNLYTISLIHEPDITDNIITKYKTNLILAGHSHNGQIRFPKTNGLLKLEEAKKYPNSKYKLKNTTLFVSNGLGTTNYELRLFNHPSINF